MQTVLPAMFLVLPFTAREIIVCYDIMVPKVINIATMINFWESTLHPLICFIYIRPLRIALCDTLKSLHSMLNSVLNNNKVSVDAPGIS